MYKKLVREKIEITLAKIKETILGEEEAVNDSSAAIKDAGNMREHGDLAAARNSFEFHSMNLSRLKETEKALLNFLDGAMAVKAGILNVHNKTTDRPVDVIVFNVPLDEISPFVFISSETPLGQKFLNSKEGEVIRHNLNGRTNQIVEYEVKKIVRQLI